MNLDTLIWIAILVLPAILQLLGKKKKPSPETRQERSHPLPPQEPWEEEWMHTHPRMETHHTREESFEHPHEVLHQAHHELPTEKLSMLEPPPSLPSPQERLARLPRLQQMIVWREILGPPRSRTGPRPPLES